MMKYIAVCCLIVSIAAASAYAVVDHSGSKPACATCHRPDGKSSDPAAGSHRASVCVSCHKGYDAIFDGPMAKRTGERDFVRRTYAGHDSRFFDKNCSSCHVDSCRQCHASGHAIRKPTVADCQVCHKGYFVGWDYSGRAPREDNMRYQRGIAVNGETFLKMSPDVHYRAGMTCGACHSMASLAEGKKSSKTCTDCHKPSGKVIEHGINAHMQKLECYACHSAWTAQEYGTFFLRFKDLKQKEDFDLKPGASPEYISSAYLRKQDAPPLGINSRGKVSPIRPQYIAYYTDIQKAAGGGQENLLLGAEWRALFPHTVQRGTVTCEGCHDNPRRFLLEKADQRIYQLRRDGMNLDSFWDQKGQRVVNGDFMAASRYLQISSKSPAYTKAYIRKWKKLLNRVEPSSRP
jgi:hypothetical protein